jgi:branched-chain amino acid transport system permease protein
MREQVKITAVVSVFIVGLVTVAFLSTPSPLEFVLISLLNGVQSAALFILLALGLTLIFGMMGVINFAHGAMFMVGGYVTYYVVHPDFLNQPFLLGVLAAVVVVGLIGFLMERLVLRGIYGDDLLLQVLFTIGVALTLEGGLNYLGAPTGASVNGPDWAVGLIDVGPVSYPAFRLFIVAVTAILVAAIYIVLTRTNVGLIIRAGIHDREMVRGLGIDVERYFTVIFVSGSALAGLAGALAAPIRSLDTSMGNDIIIETFVIVVIGGMGSFLGSILGAITVAEIQTFSIFIPVLKQYANLAIFVFMAIVLLVRPRGLLGTVGFLEE